ncbi:MAG TPA: AMP-binding protein [Thermodesulfovibrionales bacterium]|jgi:acyl-[acyl-carrier-protein]-phospholipid O-acyltransferase/long-chain-fatty-acid--[acyl-carrier-protein] ligase|nr:AMP-binding protein [Thermodesulfovibrionales bacterium]
MLLHQHFVKIARRYGNKLAFIDRTSDKRVTYTKALIASLILSEKFKKYPEGFLGIMIPTSAGSALTILGTLMSGKTPVMINYSTGAASNAIYAQKKCTFKTIITSKALLEKINCPVVEGMVFIEDIMEGISAGEKLKAALKAKLPAPLILRMVHGGQEDDNVVILFTSGSEKDPKAVQLTHRNIASNIESFSKAVQIYDHDVMLANLPYFHVFGLTVNLWTPLYFGMTIVAYANPLDYKMVCSIVREEKPTIIVGTPSFLWGYLRKSERDDFTSVRLIVSGADKCPETLRKEFSDRHGITLYEGYGATETSPVISTNTPEHNKPGSVGKVLPDVMVRIENYETGKECGIGEVGRILVKGDLVMKGYLDDFEETSMRIRHGWYDTGDMGYLDADGFLWHSGRLKRFVKIGGEMVSLVKVEDVLQKCLPENINCSVVEVPDALKGVRIVAAVTQKVDEKKILKQMSEQLPNIALPKQFVVIEELPKMGSGKIDFRTVADMVHTMIRTKVS